MYRIYILFSQSRCLYFFADFQTIKFNVQVEESVKGEPAMKIEKAFCTNLDTYLSIKNCPWEEESV